MTEAEVYLFTGPELGEKKEAIENIKSAAQKKNGSLDEYTYYAGDERIQDIVSQLQNVSLFDQALFITVRNAEQIKLKADIDMLLSWINGGAKESANTLILTSDENGIERKIESAVPPSHKKIFWEMFENRKTQWLQDFFRKNGFTITGDAIDQILDMVENNTEALKAECGRFFYCFEKGHMITGEDVDKILSHNREENAFTLFDAMADVSKSPVQRLDSSLGILQKIKMASGDGITPNLIAGLGYCFRMLRTWHALHEKGANPSDTELKASGFNKKSQEKYRNASRIWTSGATSSILALLAASDMAVRENGNGLEETRLVLMLNSIILKNGIFPTEYTQSL
ncbi:MAG: DNA polymerase III subunit delta [Treponema sp.]|nr:DNA polymerase III subunit delta [Treponema sp.]